MKSGHQNSKVSRWLDDRFQPVESDQVAVEEPLEIRVKGRSIAVTMRTPGHDRELAAGFLLSEGLIQRPADVIEIAHCQSGNSGTTENILNVFLAPGVSVDLDRLTRHVFASSSCGICGKASIESVHQHFDPVESNLTVSAATLSALPEKLRSQQKTFDQTGGLHAAAVFDSTGDLLAIREDVGRHNAVDKILGYALLYDRLPFDSQILLVSGRTSFEILQKALAARIPVIAAISAPSSLAVTFAQESGQTLIGFLRGPTFNVYSHPERIVSTI